MPLLRVLRHLSPDCLSRLLAFYHITVPPTSHSDLINDTICWLHKKATHHHIAQLTPACERLETMTDDLGYHALIYAGDDLLASSAITLTNRYDLATDIFCNHPLIFQHAEEIRYANHAREGLAWTSFQICDHPPFHGDIDKPSLIQTLRDHFKTRDVFYIDCFSLCASWDTEAIQWMVMIYRSGHWQPFLEVDTKGASLHAKRYRPAWEYLIVYTPATGVIEVVSDRQAERLALARLFSTYCLETTMPVTNIAPYYGHLTPFYSQPALPFFPKNPVEQDILWVCVSGGGLRSPHTGLMVRFLCSLKKLPQLDFYRTMDEHGLLPLIKAEKLYLNAIRLTICFAASQTGILPAETISFTITLPNRCTLKPHGIRHRYIRDVLFPRWGVIPA